MFEFPRIADRQQLREAVPTHPVAALSSVMSCEAAVDFRTSLVGRVTLVTSSASSFASGYQWAYVGDNLLDARIYDLYRRRPPA
jgi:hypothetical protein